MFISLKDKLHTVQEGITASFRGLAGHSAVQITGHSNVTNFNINSGADILHHYRLKWNELHKQAEENAFNAQEVDTRIANLHATVEDEWENINTLCSRLSRVPQVNKDLEKLVNDIGSLDKLVYNVENMLIQLEDTIEIEKLQEQELEKRFGLAMYREKKLFELENVKGQLSVNHTIKVDRHENKLKTVQKERQATFSDAFQNDLEQYKKYGSIPQKSSTGDNSLSLDEVELDYDPEEFNEFVNG